MPGSSTCFLANFNNDQSFALRNEQDNSYLSDTQTSRVVKSNSPGIFNYDPNTMAIVSVSTNLCFDDLGEGYSQTSYGYIGLQPCTNNTTQQFTYLPLTHQILNPNNPYHKCIDGGGSPVYTPGCDFGGFPGWDIWQRWTIAPGCLPGEFSSNGLPSCSVCVPGGSVVRKTSSKITLK